MPVLAPVTSAVFPSSCLAITSDYAPSRLQKLLAPGSKSKDTEICRYQWGLTELKLSEVAVREPTERWTTADAAELYDVASWGKGYFSVGANGHVWVHPTKDAARGIDLRELVEKIELRGISLQILV